jgi:aspartate 1-decarboxylase
VWDEVFKAGKPKLPVALTEYNIFAVGSNQPVSHANGMHAVLATGEAMKTGYGAATRWDLANGYDNGNDHGMFAYNEPGIPNYTPHPAFYHLYYMREHTGDVLLNSSMTGAPAVVVIPTAFSSGQIGASLINTAKVKKVVRLNLKDYKVGDRFYTYTLTGTEGQDFSRKVFINGTGPALVAGGPADYESIKAGSSLITEEIRIVLPPLSAVYVLVEPGTKTLAINNEVTSIRVTPEESEISIYPNPSDGSFTVRNIPGFVSRIEIQDLNGATVFSQENGADTSETKLTTRLTPGTYLISFRGKERSVTKKIIIK